MNQQRPKTELTEPRILILGNAGQLGQELEKAFAGLGSIVAVDRKTVDLADTPRTRAFVRSVAPSVILNAAAYTAVDRAESERELAFAINAQAPRILAEEALACNALLVHYSTDYVFDGSKSSPWIETDSTAPLNVYGASKLAGEQAIAETGGSHLIFRTSWLYGPSGNNFLLTMLRLGREREQISVVDNQFGAPTTSIQVARATRAVVSAIFEGKVGPVEDWAGLYHMTCGGSVSWFGFAQAIFNRSSSLLGTSSPTLVPIPSSHYPVPAKRPQNSVLSNQKLQERFGVRLPSWESALDETMAILSSQA